MMTAMYRNHLVTLWSFSCIIAYVLPINVYPTYGGQNSSLVLPTSVNNSALGNNPRPALPYHVQVTDSETSIQFTQYFALADANKYYPCIIQALVEIYEAAIYDRGNKPLRGDIYVLRQYNIIIDIQKIPGLARRINLKYATVVRMLQAVELFTHEYGTYGLALVIFEERVAVGTAIIRPYTENGTDE